MLQTLRHPESTEETNRPSVPSPEKRSRPKWLTAALVLAVAGGALVLMRLGPWSSRQRDLTPYVATAERGSLSGVITASGELLAVQKVNVSPRQQGRLEELLVDEGDEISEGQLLAVMDPGAIEDQLQERQALLRQAEANYRSRKDDFDRRQQLFRMGVISADNFSDVRFQMLASEAAVIAARERLEQLEE